VEYESEDCIDFRAAEEVSGSRKKKIMEQMRMKKMLFFIFPFFIIDFDECNDDQGTGIAALRRSLFHHHSKTAFT
jgi:hypothetical protein